MSLIKCKYCRGMVIESDVFFDPQSKMTEFECINCGRSFEFATARYVKVLNALDIDYRGRMK